MKNLAIKIMIIFVLLLSSTLAIAETIIIEYPDHYYVESTGSPNEKPSIPSDNVEPPSRPSPVPSRESTPPSSTKPEENAERRKALADAIGRLEREQGPMTITKEGETPDQISRKQQESYGKLMKIKRMKSELQKLTDQNGEQKR